MHIFIGALALFLLVYWLGPRLNLQSSTLLNSSPQTIAGVGLLLLSALILVRGGSIGVPFALAGAGLLGLRRDADGNWGFRAKNETAQPYTDSKHPSKDQPHIRTKYLLLVLSGRRADLDAYVTANGYEQADLAQFSDEDLLSLWGTLNHCLETQSLLHSYVALDRSEELLAQFETLAQTLSIGPLHMNRASAHGVLGLKPKASKDDIERAHRALIKLYHPDVCKTPFLAIQINAARDMLIREL